MLVKFFSKLSLYFSRDHSTVLALPVIMLDGQLKRAKESFQTLYKDHQNAVMLLNKDGFLSGNQACLNLLGCLDLECFRQLHPCDLSPEKQPCGTNSVQLFNHHIDKALLNGICKFEWQFHRCRDQKEVFLAEIVFSSFDIGDNSILHASILDISLHKTINEQLRISEMAIKSVGDGIWDWNISTDRSIYSLRWKEMLGYLDDDIVPSNEEWQSRIHSDDQEMVAAAMQAYLTYKASTYRVEYRLRCKDNSYKWILGRGMVVSRDLQNQPLRMVGTHTDITQIKEAELLLQQSMKTARQETQKAESRLEKLSMALEQSQSSVMITNLDTTIEYVNQAFVNSTGYSREEIIGQKPSLLKSDKTTRATYDAMWKALLDGKAWQGEVINRNKQGKEFIELTWISPIRQADGTISHYLGVKEDITERKQKDALLLAAKERAENLAKTKSQFLANMSHEIRTPMAAIIGFSDLALLIDMPTKVNQYVKNINTASNHLLAILNDILDISKLEAGQMTLKLARFELAELKDSLHGLLLNTAQAKGLAFTIDITPQVPKVLIGDSLRLKQALINLLGNAIKFTSQGSVNLSISLLELTTNEVRLLFEVTDTGIGISPEQQDRLFHPFSQADDGFDRSFEGTGLGLAISQDLIQLMSGNINLISRLDLGSCFSFELVLPLPKLAVSERQVKAPASLNPEPLSGIRVLVAEDNAFNQMLISEMLKNFGASTVLANNGLEALAALEQDSFDIVLMDLHMPAMDGYEATLEIRKRPHYASLPILAFSASVTEEEKQRCLATGMNDFIAKPTHKKDLLETMERWLKQKL